MHLWYLIWRFMPRTEQVGVAVTLLFSLSVRLVSYFLKKLSRTRLLEVQVRVLFIAEVVNIS